MKSSSTQFLKALFAGAMLCLDLTALVFLPEATADAALVKDPVVVWRDHVRLCLSKVFSLRADFTQEVLRRGAPPLLKMRGTVEARPDGRIRVEYNHPQRHILISNRSGFLSYDPETRTAAQSTDKSDFLLRVFGFFWGGKTESAFTVRHLGGAARPADGPAAIELAALDRNCFGERLVLGLQERCPGLQRILIVDCTGTVNRLDFDNIETNVKIPDARFFFDLPPKTRIIHL